MTKIIISAALTCFCACAGILVPGTEIKDTKDNRAIYTVVQKLREAIEERDSSAVLSLLSPDYFEDMGTPATNDDYGYVELKERVLPQSMEAAKEMHLTFEVHDIVVDKEKAYVDLRYNSRSQLAMQAGTLWDIHKEFNRIELVKEGSNWKIVTGL